MYPKRFDAKCVPVVTCSSATGTTLYGDTACKSVIDTWLKSKTTDATIPCINKPAKDITVTADKAKACEDVKNQFCYAGNVKTGTKYEGKTFKNCDLVEMAFGYAHYWDTSNVSCKNT